MTIRKTAGLTIGFLAASLLAGQTLAGQTLAGQTLAAQTLAAQTLAAQTDFRALEQRAEAEFSRHDCPAAEKSFGEALQAAQAMGDIRSTGTYYLRIGNCRTRVGDFVASLEAYRHGIAVAESTNDDELMANGVHGAALQLQKLGRIDEALPLGEKEFELTQKCGHPSHQARATWLVAELYTATGRVRDGLRLMTQAVTISRTTTDTAVTAAILQSLALIYLTQGDMESAAHIEMQILAMPDSEIASMSTVNSRAITWTDLGEIQRKAGHTAEARRSFEKAVEDSRGVEDWRVHIDALLDLAEMQNRAGQIADADAGFREAMALAEKVDFGDLRSAAWQARSEALRARGDFRGAVDAGSEALRVARQLNSPDRVYKALVSYGAAQAAAGERAGARAEFDEALGLAETLRAQAPGEVSDLSRAFANFIPLYQAAVRNLMDLHLPAEALQRAEQAKARVLIDILLRGGVDEHRAMTRAEADEQERLRKRLAVAHAQTPESAGTLEDAMVEYRQFRRALYDNHPELAVQAADFEPASPAKLVRLLRGPKSALLDYFLVPSGVALIVVRQRAGSSQPVVSAFFLPDPKHTLAAEARGFREQMAARDPGYKNAARRLFDRVVAPALAELGGTTDWIVSPDGGIWDIPFEALVYPDGRHIIETTAVTLAPSLTAALEIRQRSRTGGKEAIRLLAFGNPLPSPVPLPDAAQEVTEIGTNYPRGSTLVLTGALATAEEFRQRAPSARIIHLAAHAGLNDNDPLSSFVQLGAGVKKSAEEGNITALEIMSLRLQADMVVLSACETALGTTGPGEGMIGMGWALSAAGASSSVLSLWKVDSAASRFFMTSFYRNLTIGRSGSGAGALRQTGLEMLRTANYRHPFYWAAFTLWGDGSAAQR